MENTTYHTIDGVPRVSDPFSLGLNTRKNRKEAMLRRADEIKSDFLIRTLMEAML